jgi:hypothetical protein
MRPITFADWSQRHHRRKRASRIPLFANGTKGRRSPQLQNVSSLNQGMVHLRYTFKVRDNS